jgi:DeoR family suf operon transcriptional repressor
METTAIATFGEGQRRLLTLLLETKSGLSIDELAEGLDISRSAVHQHLAAMERDGFVTKEARASQGGRPGFGWKLTERGVHLFPKQYALFSDLLIRSLKEKLGSRRLTDVLRDLGVELAGQHAHRLKGLTATRQIEEVSRIMLELGYQTETRADPGRKLPLIAARNCIYHHLAQEHREVCELDLALLSTLLKADIEHVECMVRGGGACQFRVLKRRPARATGTRSPRR